MEARIQRWGNSLALRLPKAVAEQVGVSEGSAVELVVHQGRLTLRALRRYRLDDLLSQVRPGNRHGEVPVGPRRGREVW
jgi:antitoxin MazE